MRIKNTLEDLVFNLVETILLEYKDESMKKPKFKLDLVCFVLNRVKPNYIVSSRGLVHQEKEFERDPQFLADLITLIYDGIEIISKRRNEIEDFEEENINWEISYNTTNDFYFNFPLFLGKVYNAKNFDLLSDIDVYLKDENDTIVEMATPLWQNPYHISPKTPGIYTFWPMSIKAKTEDNGKTKKFNFVLEFKHKDFLTEKKVFTIEIISKPTLMDYIRRGETFEIDPVYMEPK